MSYNTFAFFQNGVQEYRAILKQMKFKNHHRTNNKHEAGERESSPGEKPAADSGRNLPADLPAAGWVVQCRLCGFQERGICVGSGRRGPCVGEVILALDLSAGSTAATRVVEVTALVNTDYGTDHQGR